MLKLPTTCSTVTNSKEAMGRYSCNVFLSFWFGLDHVVDNLIFPVFGFPGFALIRKLVHLTWVDRTILLTSREANDSQAFKFQIANPVLILGQILHLQSGDMREIKQKSKLSTVITRHMKKVRNAIFGETVKR